MRGGMGGNLQLVNKHKHIGYLGCTGIRAKCAIPYM